jgi:hypothetical protein
MFECVIRVEQFDTPLGGRGDAPQGYWGDFPPAGDQLDVHRRQGGFYFPALKNRLKNLLTPFFSGSLGSSMNLRAIWLTLSDAGLVG